MCLPIYNKLLPAGATFEVARYAMTQAAQTLFSRCGTEMVAVNRAWDAVGAPGLWQPCVRPPSRF